mmetsp:Transcript_12257/g.20914  ORF Transcript_12257/g.20914 Transcript_12257/m.20914 type:complete len:458 (-) Transcript_12257:122-1495(-)
MIQDRMTTGASSDTNGYNDGPSASISTGSKVPAPVLPKSLNAISISPASSTNASSKPTSKSPSPVSRKRNDLENYIWYKNYFSEREIDALCAYKNHGADFSLSYKYIMNPMYLRAVNYLPLWLAPNCVTLIGLFGVLLPHLLTAYYSPLLDAVCPWWCYVLSGLGLLFYQFMDNLDGKQARRTGSSSPLGHLFDHGCDALNVTISGLSFVNTLRLGSSMWSFSLIFWMGFVVFYAATLEEFFTSALILREINGPNEGLLIMVGVHFLTAIVGPQIWLTEVTVNGITFPLNHIFVYLIPVLTIPTMYLNYKIASGKGRVSELFKASIPLLFFSAYTHLWGMCSPVAITQYPILFIWVVGLAFFYIVSRMIISHLTNSEFPWFIPMLTPLGVGAANAVIGTLFFQGQPPLPELPLLVIGGVIEFVTNARRVFCITHQICEHLGIFCFKLGKRKRDESVL